MKKILIAIPLVLIVAVVGLWAYSNYQAKAIVDQRIEEMVANGQYRALSYESLEVRLNGDVVMQNLHIIDPEANELIIQDIVISNLDYQHETPHHMTLTASGMQLPKGLPQMDATENQALNAYLQKFQYGDTIPATIEYAYDYDPEDNFRIDSSASFEVVNALNFSSRSVTRNVPIENMSGQVINPQMPQQSMLMLQQLHIPEASMELSDLGLVDAFINIQAEQLSVSPDEYREQLKSQVQSMAFLVPSNLQELAFEMSEHVVSFLDGDKTLKISLAPDFAGDIQQLQPQIMGSVFSGDYNRVIELLHLQVSTD